MRTFWLSMHARYACRHAGACCSAGWDIPLETARVDTVAAVAGGRQWLRAAPHAPADVAGILALGKGGHCIFHDRDRRPHGQVTAMHRGGCEIHRVAGHAALPSACQHFPRECLIDARGVFVTLSHYCPTAAAMLFEHRGPVAIVEGPAVIPGGEPEGLDARDALPPLLTRGVLMDVDGYAAWEAHVVHVLAGNAEDDRLPEQVLAALVRDACEMSRWRPGNESLRAIIGSLAARRTDPPTAFDIDWNAERRTFDIARSALPEPHCWPDYPPAAAVTWQALAAPSWSRFAPVVRRFLAAHAFASWMAYQGAGLVPWVRRLDLAVSVLRAEAIRECAATGGPLTRSVLEQAIRQADLLIVHLCDRTALANGISVASA